MRPITVSVGPLAAASANNIALSQTPGAAGNLTLNGSTVVGGVAILDTPRRVLFTTTADETAKTFVVTGTTFGGQTVSETVKGVNNSTVATVLDYATITSIAVSAALAGAITVGTNGVAGSPWVRLDDWALPNLNIQAIVVGTINYTIQQTYDDPNSPTNPVSPANVTWSQLVAAASASAIANVAYQPVFVRVLVNSNTNPATVTATFLQTGVTPK